MIKINRQNFHKQIKLMVYERYLIALIETNMK